MVNQYYNYLISNSNLKILIYSGDNDAQCSTFGTQYWMWQFSQNNNLTLNKQYDWKQWIDKNEQVGGYILSFDSTIRNRVVTLVTIHSAGHEVPSFKPQRAYQVFLKFILNL